MDSLCLLFFLTVSYYSVEVAAFALVTCKPDCTGQYGQSTLLECSVITAQVEDPQIRSVTWKMEGVEEALLFYNKNNMRKEEGYSFAESSWNERKMNVSLLITNTTMQHNGSYTCDVFTSAGIAQPGRTRLTVTAKYSKPAIIARPETITQNADGTLECHSVGGYPRGQLRWFDGEKYEWTGSAESVVVPQTDSGLFSLSSKLTLKRGYVSFAYTCTVTNTSGGKDDEYTIQIPDGAAPAELGQDQPQSVTKVVAPLVIIGSLIVGLLVLVLVRWRRSRRQHECVCRHEPDEMEGFSIANGHQEKDQIHQGDLA